MGVEYSPKGLTRVILPCGSKEEVLVKAGIKSSSIENDGPDSGEDLPHRLQRYFAGEPVDFPDKLDFAWATLFQKSVWKATQTVPFGETRSYAWVAGKINCNSARAVGQALGKNPVPIVVPCHRIINSNGKLGGFGGGLEIKENLLDLEKTR